MISGSFSLPSLLTSSLDSAASKNLEDATEARRAFEVTQREQEKTNQANSAGSNGYGSYGSQTANTLFQAQDIAQQFKDYMDKSPDEMLREQILKELGYTEEQLAGMSPEDRAKAEIEIIERIKLKVEQSMREKGVEVDIGATAPA